MYVSWSLPPIVWYVSHGNFPQRVNFGALSIFHIVSNTSLTLIQKKAKSCTIVQPTMLFWKLRLKYFTIQAVPFVIVFYLSSAIFHFLYVFAENHSLNYLLFTKFTVIYFVTTQSTFFCLPALFLRH